MPLSLFSTDANEAILPQFYVLDPTDRETFDKALAELRRALGQVDVSFLAAPWAELRQALEVRDDQIAAAHKPGKRRPDNVDSSNAMMLVRAETVTAMVPFAPSRHVSLAAFTKATEATIQQRGDARLTESHQRLAAAAKQPDAQKQAAADYFAHFLPSDKDVKTEDASVLRRIFNAVLSMLKQFLASMVQGATLLWDVLKDPDAYYLRLRGEVQELAIRRPEYAFLNVVMFVPDLFRLYVRLLWDERVATKSKLRVAQALAYLVMPVDLIPEALVGPVGYVDDVYFMALALLQLTSNRAISRELLLEHWAGDPRQLDGLIAFSTFASENFDIFRVLGGWFQQKK